MDPISDILHQKAKDLDIGRKKDIDIIQLELDRLFAKRIRARKFDTDGTLLLTTSSASMASKVKLNQYSLLESLKDQTERPINNVIIRIQQD